MMGETTADRSHPRVGQMGTGLECLIHFPISQAEATDSTMPVLHQQNTWSQDVHLRSAPSLSLVLVISALFCKNR